MFGGVTNGYHVSFTEEHQSQYDNIINNNMSALPQFQLFEKLPVGCAIDNINFVGNEHATGSGRPMKRAHEVGQGFTQQKIQRSLNNLCHDDAGLVRTAMNQDHVSTGLKLSYGEDERNSSITSVNESLGGLRPVTCSLNNSIQLEMDCQYKLLDHYVRVQEENMMKGIRELNQKHTALLLNTLETEVRKKLNAKDAEIVIMNRKNMELEMKIRQVSMEAQAWHHRAKYNESVVNALKNDLQQIIPTKRVQPKEGYGDSEVDDAAASYTNVNDALGDPDQTFSTKQLICKACSRKEVCVLLLPCRHLCLCKDCEVLVDKCPVCRTTKTESVHVIMS